MVIVSDDASVGIATDILTLFPILICFVFVWLYHRNENKDESGEYSKLEQNGFNYEQV